MYHILLMLIQSFEANHNYSIASYSPMVPISRVLPIFPSGSKSPSGIGLPPSLSSFFTSNWFFDAPQTGQLNEGISANFVPGGYFFLNPRFSSNMKPQLEKKQDSRYCQISLRNNFVGQKKESRPWTYPL